MAPRRVKAPKLEPGVPLFKLYLHRAIIFSSYCQLMKEIYDDLKKGGELVNGKLITPKSGIFLVQLVPEKEDDLPLTFLFRRSDLYVESYHYDRTWYRFSDYEADLPSKNQLDYTQIVKLFLSSSYAHLGRYNINVGHAAFKRCYHVLRKTNMLYTSSEGLQVLQSGPLATPAVGIAEALRFEVQLRLVKQALKDGKEVYIPNKISQYFHSWGTFSVAMYTKEIPNECLLSLAQISNKLWVIKRQNKEALETKKDDEELLASLNKWHTKDEKKIVEAVCNVGDIRDTAKLYTEGLGMKMIRRKVYGEDISCHLGFGVEQTNFALKLNYNHGITKYDIGEGFGHFTVAVQNVSQVEKRVISNGGDITRVKGRLSDAVFAKDGDGYTFELIERNSAPEPLCGIMLHIGDLQRSITFYRKALGMKLLTLISVPEFKYTTVKLGYANEGKETVLELRYYYGIEEYQRGNAYSQLVIATDNIYMSAEAVKLMVKLLGGKVLQQPEAPTMSQPKTATFLDPEGWKVVLVDKADFLAEIEKTPAA